MLCLVISTESLDQNMETLKEKFLIGLSLMFIILYIMASPLMNYALSGENALAKGLFAPNFQRPNVLFICVDDLGEDISPYNKLKERNDPFYQKVYTPNLERLASDSLVLAQAYNQFPYCNPSRSSLLTGRRPDTTHVYNLKTKFREVGGNFTTIPQYFKENGYHSFGVGKVFHHHRVDIDPLSWSEPFAVSQDDHYRTLIGDGRMAVGKLERLDHPIADDITLEIATEKMRAMSSFDIQPWFLAVGFGATHTPLVFPEEHLQLYPLENITLPRNMYPPVNVPAVSQKESSTWLTRTSQSLLPEQRLEPGAFNSTTVLLEWRQAYYGTVSYLDSSVGKLLDELERLDLSRNTIVAFWTDHGYIMGEHGRWGKNALYDRDLRCPMMLRIPGLTDGGVTVTQITEYVDLFPTLVEAAGLTRIPQCPENSRNIRTCHEGASMFPLIQNPLQKWKKAAFSQVRSFRGDGVNIELNTSRTQIH